MLRAEWPLAIFTLLGQAACGLFLAVAIVREILSRKADTAQAVKFTFRATLTAGVLMLAATIVSLLHLGTPMGAYRSLFHLGSSWLSREILASILFGVLWVVATLMEKRGAGGLWLGRLTALAGLFLVFAMSRIYMASVIPAWTSAFTLISFAATALVLGGLAILVFLPAEAAALVRPVGPAMALTGLVLQVGVLPFYIAGLGQGSDAARSSLALLMGAWQPYLISHVVLTVLAGVVLGAMWLRRSDSFRLVYTALLLGLTGEAMARVVFYAIGIPTHIS
ncbi:MAG TPA: DmsC/YnfH family molybdoenzyme membrane anchor subunit [Symbiobacteriaceae bacterium]|jgi:anaerobic dimethyl sulfoxide reductase subunit C (anchor subunit)|nr:DmsC/YnfH family molybdoenzyme membrane anchor subunit [Symbiobacteriaceae bacterium]